jgi:hypothetical protein
MKARSAGFASALVCLGSVRPSESYSSVTPAPKKFLKFSFFNKAPKQSSDNHRTSAAVSSEATSTTAKRRGWHQRVWSKVLRRPKEGVKMNMQALAVADEKGLSVTDLHSRFEDAFVFNSFQFKPSEAVSREDSSYPPPLMLTIASDALNSVNDLSFTLLDRVSLIEIGTNAGDAALMEAAAIGDSVIAADPASEAIALDRDSPFVRFTRMTFQNILAERLDRWSNGTNLNTIIKCDPTSNLLQFLRGQFFCDATVNVDRIAFGTNLRISGGQLLAKHFCLNLLSFAPDGIPLTPARPPRYPNQFDLLAQNFTFTQEDLCESALIRNGLRRVLSRILKKRGITALTVSIQSIKILPNGKVSCLGQATMLFGPPLFFEVQSGIAFTSRGHILTFPGLQISLNPSLGIFVPMIPEVSVDLGHNAQLLDVTIDGAQSKLHVSARVTITPEHTIQLKNYIQLSQSYGALCSVDVGRWLTQIGRFAS